MGRYRKLVVTPSALVVLVLLSCALMPHPHAGEFTPRDDCFLCHAHALTVESRPSGELIDTFSWCLLDLGPEDATPSAGSNLGARAPPA